MSLEYKVIYLDGETVSGVGKQEAWFLKVTFNVKSTSGAEGKCVQISVDGVPHHTISGPFRCENPDCKCDGKALCFQIPKTHIDAVAKAKKA
jgi:hypothetical protein